MHPRLAKAYQTTWKILIGFSSKGLGFRVKSLGLRVNGLAINPNSPQGGPLHKMLTMPIRSLRAPAFERPEGLHAVTYTLNAAKVVRVLQKPENLPTSSAYSPYVKRV